MKTIMITAPSSNTGKTTLTLGLLRNLKDRGLDITGFKTGPDYIDPLYHEVACGNRSGNLDIHMMGEDGIKQAISISRNEYAVVEGAMGYFDGTYNTYESSSFHISEILDIPSILVYTPKGEMFSAIPKIKGMHDFSNGRIKGIILNKTSKRVYEMLKEQIENYTDLEVLGYVEKDDLFEIPSRYLGLLQPHENKDLAELIETISKKIEETVNVDKLIGLMKEVEVDRFIYPENKDITVAIAMDKAFNFYYTEDLKLFENTCNVTYFSPLEDDYLPKCDLLYISGGYPELYKKELAENKSMLESIKNYAENDGFIYAEGGGMMYLTESIDDVKMCGVLKAKSEMTDKTQKFGYTYTELKEDLFLGKKGDILRSKEFHKSIIKSDSENIFNISKPMSDKTWESGYRYKNVVCSYSHLNFLGNLNAFDSLLKSVKGEIK